MQPSSAQNDIDAVLATQIHATAEEQREIREQIEKVLQETRLAFQPEALRVKAATGWSLTLALNLVTLLVLAGGVWTIQTFYHPSGVETPVSESRIKTAEARLLEEIKREAELALSEKDREIAEIQARLANIDREKQSILAESEARLRAKERELEARLQAEVERERQRLLNQGIAREEVERRVREFTERKRRELEAELQAFRLEQDQERRRLERALEEAQSNYRASLNAAAAERQRILDEMRRREQEVQNRTTSLSAQLQQAQAELNLLRSRSERLAALDDQVAGLVARARDQYIQARWSDLLETAKAIAEVARLPAFEQDAASMSRRTAPLLLAQVLTSIAESRLTQQEAEQRSDGTASVAQALALQRNWLEAEALLRSAEGDWRAERYEAAQSKTLQALNLLQLNPAGEAFLRRWLELGSERALQEKADQDTREAQTLYSQAVALRSTDPQRARALASTLLTNYPLAEQRREALQILQQAAEDTERPLLARIRELERLTLESQSDRPVANLAALEAEVGRLRSENSQLQGQNEGLRRQVASLEQQLALAREQQGRAQASPTPAVQDESAQLRSRLNALEADLRQARDQLNQAREEIQRIQQERQQDALLATRLRRLRESYESMSRTYGTLSPEQELERAQLLSSFLNQASEAEAFPNLKSRVDALVAAARTAGQRESLYYVSDVLEGTIVLTEEAAVRAYFSTLKTRYRNDPGMLDFLATLERYVNLRRP